RAQGPTSDLLQGGRLLLPVAMVGGVLLLLLFSAIRFRREYGRLVVFRFGRFVGVRGPGFTFVIPMVEEAVKVDLRVIVLDVPPQDVISKDNVSVKVNAVIYFCIIDPELASIQVSTPIVAPS